MFSPTPCCQEGHGHPLYATTGPLPLLKASLSLPALWPNSFKRSPLPIPSFDDLRYPLTSPPREGLTAPKFFPPRHRYSAQGVPRQVVDLFNSAGCLLRNASSRVHFIYPSRLLRSPAPGISPGYVFTWLHGPREVVASRPRAGGSGGQALKGRYLPKGFSPFFSVKELERKRNRKPQ